MGKIFSKDNLRYGMIIAVILGFIFLMMDLNSRLSELFRLQDQRDQAATDVAYLQVTRSALEVDMRHADSEEAVAVWARLHRMSLPDDQVIIPLPGEGPTPTPMIKTVVTEGQPENWQVWRALFFNPK